MVISFIMYILPVFALISAALYFAVYFIFRARTGKRPPMRHITLWVTVCYWLSLVYLTILWYWPDITFFPDYYFLNLKPFVWLSETYVMGTQRMLEQLALNVAMFVPLGVLFPMVHPRLRRFAKTAAAVLATTLAIETLQYFMGRSADIDDVLTNLAGGMIGYLLFYLGNRWFGKRRWWRNATRVSGADK